MIFGQFANLCLFALTAIAMALILAHFSDSPSEKLQQWSRWRLGGRISLAKIVAAALNVSTVCLMIMRMADLVEGVSQSNLTFFDMVLVVISSMALTLAVGCSAFAIAIVLEKVKRNSTQPHSLSVSPVA